MQNNNSCKRLALLLCVVAILASCGQKGDLYLPEGKVLSAWVGL